MKQRHTRLAQSDKLAKLAWPRSGWLWLVRPNPRSLQPLQPGQEVAGDGCGCLALQGVVNTSEGKVVRAFHRFTLVDQTGELPAVWIPGRPLSARA